jgi:hypothetical protein
MIEQKMSTIEIEQVYDLIAEVGRVGTKWRTL